MSERTRAILHRLLAGAVIVGSLVAIWSFISGCAAATRVTYPVLVNQDTGEVHAVEYVSAKDVTGLYVELTPDGGVHIEVDEAMGSRQADAQAAALLELIKRIPQVQP